MNILWMSWKDRTHPFAGGAEVVQDMLVRRLAASGHSVTILTSVYAGGLPEETRDGYRIIRRGGRWTVYFAAWQYYRRHLHGWADVVIDETNTIPFFARWYAREPVVMLIHQTCHEIWFFEMFFPLNFVGYWIEPVYLWLLRRSRVITVSESTRRDLVALGYVSERIHIISEGIEMSPADSLKNIQKSDDPTILALGSIRAMKRTLDIVYAFEIARDSDPSLRLVVAGKAVGAYGARVIAAIRSSRHASAIDYRGHITPTEKISLLRSSHLVAVASVREGWCLVVTEAASQGTPAVVYDVPGLRDSVRPDETGTITTKNTPDSLAKSILDTLRDPERYERLRHAGWLWSREITFERSMTDFVEVLHFFGIDNLPHKNIRDISPLNRGG